MQESFGERSTLGFATSRVVRSIVEWGALDDAEGRGSYIPVSSGLVLGREPTLILVEGLLRHVRKSLPREEILSHPALFPFNFRLSLHDLRTSAQFSVSRQGMDMDYIGLCEPF
jgi:hypothetical protein